MPQNFPIIHLVGLVVSILGTIEKKKNHFSWVKHLSLNGLHIFEKHDTFCVFLDYYNDGFLTLQYYLDTSLISILNHSAKFQRNKFQMSRFPYPPWRDDMFVLVLQQQFPFLLILSFIFTVLYIVKDVVHEKERKIKVW